MRAVIWRDWHLFNGKISSWVNIVFVIVGVWVSESIVMYILSLRLQAGSLSQAEVVVGVCYALLMGVFGSYPSVSTAYGDWQDGIVSAFRQSGRPMIEYLAGKTVIPLWMSTALFTINLVVMEFMGIPVISTQSILSVVEYLLICWTCVCFSTQVSLTIGALSKKVPMIAFMLTFMAALLCAVMLMILIQDVPLLSLLFIMLLLTITIGTSTFFYHQRYVNTIQRINNQCNS